MNKFSIYHNGIKNTIPNGFVDLIQFLGMIKQDSPLLQKIRQCETKEERDKLKSKLSYVTFAGIFTKRGIESLKESSGLVCLDYDGVDNIEEIKDKLIQNKYTHCVFISPSGKGLKLIVKIPKVKCNEEYKEYWNSISKHYNLGETDEATKDISRACYLSYDPKPYFNQNSEIYTERLENTLTTTNNTQEKDYSRSALEFRKAIALFKKGKSREQVSKELMAYKKFADAPEQYRVLTLDKAESFVLDNEEKPKQEEEEKEPEISEDVLEKFKDKGLIERIKERISKDHLEDDNLKMSVHLTHISGLLKNPKRRQSFKISGKTAEGKDNLQISSLKHLPDKSYLFLTSATQAVLEDDLKEIPILAISELNLFREGGANKNLLEVVKQRTEGGTSAFKKDLRNNQKTLREEKGEQGVVTFGTIEAEDDEELGTRTMQGTIKATPKRIKIVNENTLDIFSDENKIINQLIQEDSWIKKGYTYFWKRKPQYEIVIPYAKFLKEEIDGIPIFDCSEARSQRDLKRLLSLTCAMTWIYQEQREKKEVNGNWFLVSKPEDFINTLKYTNEFFNQTYAGFDLRITGVLKFIESNNRWIDKLEIQQNAGVKHRGTINNYLWALESQGLIEKKKGKELCEECSKSVQGVEHFNAKTYKGNHIYYRSVQKASNKRLISVQLNKLKEFLDKKSVQKSVQKRPKMKKKVIIDGKLEKNSSLKKEIEHLKLNTSKIDFSKSGIKEALEDGQN